MVYLIKTEIISKEMDKYMGRALLVMLTLGLCVCKNPTIRNASKCMVCFVYKWASMHKVYISIQNNLFHNRIRY